MNAPVCCRVCLSEQQLNPIFKNHDDEEKYELLFNLIAGERISKQDEIPALICTTCVNFINQSIKFRKKCVESTKILKENLSKGLNYKNLKQVTDGCRDFVYMNVNYYFDLEVNEMEAKQLIEESDDDISSEKVLEMYRYGLKKPIANLYNSTDICNEIVDYNKNSDLDIYDSDNEMSSEKILELYKNHVRNKRKCFIKMENVKDDEIDSAKNNQDDSVMVLQVTSDPEELSWEVPIKNELTEDDNLVMEVEVLEESGDETISIKNECDDSKRSKTDQEPSTESLLKTFRKHMIERFNRRNNLLKRLKSISNSNVKMKKKVQKEYKCELCNRLFKSYNYKKICPSHKEIFICEHCGITISRPYYLYHCKAAHGYKKDKCKYCDYEANDVTSLRIHERKHTGEKPYKCKECGAAFHRYNTYRQHSSVHSTEKILKCSLCPKMFKSRSCLHSHKYVVHKKQKYEFRCSLCSKIYVKHYVAVKHVIKSHSVEKDDARKHIEKLNKFLC